MSKLQGATMKSTHKNTCVILGNGPSLKGFDFKRLNQCSSVGMNAAYRFWDTIDWYPTYYTCLDDQLIQTHHGRIYDMWKAGRIRHFYLEGGFFDLHPDCIGAAGMTSLDQTVKVLHDRRGHSQGWDLIDHPAFRTHDHNKITTGAYAIRFATWLGYKRIGIAGVDLKYVEILPEAEAADGYSLKMKSTPKVNPNYFFDGYQQAGDRYNIPNPEVHQNRLHIDSFHVLAKDFADNKVNSSLLNTNPNSLLQEERVVPLCSMDRLLQQEGISAVVVPTNILEKQAILDNFRIWADPAYAPVAEPIEASRPTLAFYFNNDTGRSLEDEIRTAYADTGMERYFSGLEFEYLGLTGDRDLYERDYTKTVGEHGYKSGPNNQFFETMRRSACHGTYVFQMETDCAPLGPDWLAAMDKDVREQGPLWVLGSRYHGVHPLEPAFRFHLNGNAIYAVGDPGFQEFLEAFWESWTWRLVAEADPRLAYDCILEKVFNELGNESGVEATRIRAYAMLRDTTTVLNISGRRDLGDGLAADYETRLKKQFPKAKLLHNRTAQQRVIAKVDSPSHPRMIMIDMTVMGNGTATGEIKSNLAHAWPAERLMQLGVHGKDGLVLVNRGENGLYRQEVVDREAAFERINAFEPDLVLYRPVPNVPWLHDAAMDLIEDLNKPVMTWIMDDWPADLAVNDPDQWADLKPDLEMLLQQSSERLSICEAMSKAMGERYGVPFTALANGVDPNDWRTPPIHARKPLRVRYAGGLAGNMTRASLLRIARAVETLGESGQQIAFEINTQPWWYKESLGAFEEFQFTTVASEERSAIDYRVWLSQADFVVIAYNFDEQTLRYVRYSMANKMPECLASGAVLLAHGPQEAATIEYLAGKDIASVITEQNEAAIEAELLRLIKDPAERNAIAERARNFVFEHHNIKKLRDTFRDLAAKAAKGVTPSLSPSTARVADDLPARANTRHNMLRSAQILPMRNSRPAAGRRIDLLSLASGRSSLHLVRAFIVELALDRNATSARLASDPNLRTTIIHAIATIEDNDPLGEACIEAVERAELTSTLKIAQ